MEGSILLLPDGVLGSGGVVLEFHPEVDEFLVAEGLRAPAEEGGEVKSDARCEDLVT